MTYLADKKTLYLLAPGLRIWLTPTQVRWQADGRETQSHPREGVRDIIVLSDATLDKSLFHFVADTHCPVSVLDTRFHFLASINPPDGGSGNLRLRQYAFCSDGTKRLTTARAIVAAKIANQRMLLSEYNRVNATVEDAVIALADEQTLLGLEGAAARVYFDAWSDILTKTPFTFDGRRKHPATDPVNALYDFAISLLTHEIDTFCRIVGLDAYIGVYHTSVHYRPALVADLVEEWRAPIVDKFVLRALRRAEFSLDDFEERGNACRFKSSCWGKAIVKWQEWYAEEERDRNSYRPLTYRDWIEAQVRHFARVCQGDEAEYRPYRYQP
ncbi:MAG: CRISPR-associated endonuclease Cas1 [Candidatus Kerfeldbacteria bacterium]|nr:CRISPR-associated endonuclease Cas1 [Candidatus Kerfeldbacteria bacterium]